MMDDLLADFVAETREMLEASGGEIVACGTPEDLARVKHSHTGQSLVPVIKANKKSKAKSAPKRRTSGKPAANNAAKKKASGKR